MLRSGSIKLAAVISAVAVVLVGLIVFWFMWPAGPKPSGRFTVEPITVVGDPWSVVEKPTGGGDGAADINAAIAAYDARQTEIETERYRHRDKANQPDLFDQIRAFRGVQLTIGQALPWRSSEFLLASAGKGEFHFENIKQPPLEWREPMEFRRRLESIAAMAITEGRMAELRNRPQDAEKLYQAVLVYGHRLAENRVRVSYQIEGLAAQSAAAERLARLYVASKQADKAQAAEQYMKAVNAALNKVRQVYLPLFHHVNNWHPGDLIMFAREHSNPAWRVEAALALGMCQHNPSVGDHQDAVVRCIAELAHDSDKAVAAAAAWARDLKKEEYRVQSGVRH